MLRREVDECDRPAVARRDTQFGGRYLLTESSYVTSPRAAMSASSVLVNTFVMEPISNTVLPSSARFGRARRAHWDDARLAVLVDADHNGRVLPGCDAECEDLGDLVIAGELLGSRVGKRKRGRENSNARDAAQSQSAGHDSRCAGLVENQITIRDPGAPNGGI